MRKLPLLFLSILILSLFIANSQDSVYCEENNGFGNPHVPEIAFVNWSRFWKKFNAHTAWDLEYNNGSGWISDKSALDIIKVYQRRNITDHWTEAAKNESERVKIALNFTAPYTANYRLTFGIDLDVKNYTHKTGSFNYTISYQNYTVYFDWTDLTGIPNLQLSHGVKPVGDETYYWFRIRKDNVAEGKNVYLDPTFGYESVGGSTAALDVFALGSHYSPSSNGTAKNITLYISCDDAENIKVAIYNYTDCPGSTAQDLVTNGTGNTGGALTDWFTVTVTDASIYSTQEYWLLARSDDNCDIYYDTTGDGGDGHWNNDYTYAQFPPDPISGDGCNARNYSIYCTYELLPGGLDLSYTLFENFNIWSSVTATLELAGLDLAYTLFETVRFFSSVTRGIERVFVTGDVITFYDSVAATFEGIGYEFAYVLFETVRLWAAPIVTLEVAAVVAALTINDVASLAAISFIIGIIAFTLILAKMGKDAQN